MYFQRTVVTLMMNVRIEPALLAPRVNTYVRAIHISRIIPRTFQIIHFIIFADFVVIRNILVNTLPNHPHVNKQ